jgi:hypothetical protein
MYTFRPYTFGWLKVFVAQPRVGALWHKVFQPGVTPTNQFSLNIYTAGRFEIRADSVGFRQVLGVGQSNLDLTLDEFPSSGLVVETPLEEPACRMCVSVDGGGKWTRVPMDVAEGGVVPLTLDQIAAVIPKAGWTGDGAPDFRVGETFTCDVPSTVYVMQRRAAEIEWEYANTLERNSQWVQNLSADPGMTSEQLDQLFITASTL